MLSDIRNSWPPSPSTTTGTKKGFGTTMSLAGLHTPGWWTGVRISLPEDATFRVRLHTETGLAFASESGSCEWTQANQVWVPLPWPIPAAMATAMDIRVSISTEAYITCCFHELPRMRPTDKYLFMHGSSMIHQWNGRQNAWGNAREGVPPVWRTIHQVVPPMTTILKGWDNRVFCIHDWSETLSASSASSDSSDSE